MRRQVKSRIRQRLEMRPRISFVEHAVYIQQKEVNRSISASEQVRMLLFSLLTMLLGSRLHMFTQCITEGRNLLFPLFVLIIP